MTFVQILQAGSGLLAAGTPLIVVSIVGRPSRRLIIATTLLAVPVVWIGLSVAPESLTFALASITSFVILAGFGFADLHAIDTATREARELDSSERIASLQPRSVAAFVSLGSRLLPYAVAALGLIIFSLRWLAPVPNRRPLVGAVFAFAALVFLLLYDRWIYEEVCGPQAEGGRPASEIARRVLSIRRMQMALVAGLFFAAAILIGLDWTTNLTLALACALGAGALGIVGCAKALASAFSHRRYKIPVKRIRNA
jgi:hypothetical protein